MSSLKVLRFTSLKFLGITICKLHKFYVSRMLSFTNAKFHNLKLPELWVSSVSCFTNDKFHNLILPESWVSQVLGYSSFEKTTSFAKIEVSGVVSSLKDFCFSSLKFLDFTICMLPRLWVSHVLGSSSLAKTASFTIFNIPSFKFHEFTVSQVSQRLLAPQRLTFLEFHNF